MKTVLWSGTRVDPLHLGDSRAAAVAVFSRAAPWWSVLSTFSLPIMKLNTTARLAHSASGARRVGKGCDRRCITVRAAFLFGLGWGRRGGTLDMWGGRCFFRWQTTTAVVIFFQASRKGSKLQLQCCKAKVCEKQARQVENMWFTHILWNAALHHEQQAHDEKPASRRIIKKKNRSQEVAPLIAYLTFKPNVNRHVFFKPGCGIIVCNWRLM